MSNFKCISFKSILKNKFLNIIYNTSQFIIAVQNQYSDTYGQNIILNRLKKYPIEIIEEYQASFTAGKSTTDKK